jgi:mannose-6-phosphate isomerase-like protein (cupin superfamily)
MDLDLSPTTSASVEPKTWGKTWPVIETDHYARYALIGLQGGYSSLHYHRQRANRFVVERGAILVWQIFGLQIETSQPITDGGTFEVPSLVVHGFAVLEDARLIEEYWPDRGGLVRRDDICRLCHGGRLKAPQDFATLPRTLLGEHPFTP